MSFPSNTESKLATTDQIQLYLIVHSVLRRSHQYFRIPPFEMFPYVMAEARVELEMKGHLGPDQRTASPA